jgi:hypothetical protein
MLHSLLILRATDPGAVQVIDLVTYKGNCLLSYGVGCTVLPGCPFNCVWTLCQGRLKVTVYGLDDRVSIPSRGRGFTFRPRTHKLLMSTSGISCIIFSFMQPVARIVTRVRTGRSGVRMVAVAREFSFLQNVQTSFAAPRYYLSFLGGNATGA